MTTYDETSIGDVSPENGWTEFVMLRGPFWAKPIDDGDEVVTPFGTVEVTDPAFVAFDPEGDPFVIPYDGFIRLFTASDADGFISPGGWFGQTLPAEALFLLYDSSVNSGVEEVNGMSMETFRRIVRIMQSIVKGTYWEVADGEYAEPTLPVSVSVDGYACVFDALGDPDEVLSLGVPYGVTITPEV